MLSRLRSKYFLAMFGVVIVSYSAFIIYNWEMYYKYFNKYKEFRLLPKLVSFLKVYTVYDNNGPIKLVRIGRANDGGYIVPELALQKADVLIGYGIADDISFEEQFSNLYNKKSYGFDCGIKNINIKNKLCIFIPECIATDSFLYVGKQSSNKVSSFRQQVTKLNLKNKKIFIKMDIEGAEYDAMPEILNYAQNITGIVLEIHFAQGGYESINKAIRLLSSLDKDFILVHLHGNNCSNKEFTTYNSKGKIPRVLELSYINRLLINKFFISSNQKHPIPMDMVNCLDICDATFEILL